MTCAIYSGKDYGVILIFHPVKIPAHHILGLEYNERLRQVLPELFRRGQNGILDPLRIFDAVRDLQVLLPDDRVLDSQVRIGLRQRGIGFSFNAVAVVYQQKHKDHRHNTCNKRVPLKLLLLQLQVLHLNLLLLLFRLVFRFHFQQLPVVFRI